MSRLFPEETQILQCVFYQSVVGSAIYFAVVCWGSSISVRDANRINKLIHKVGAVIGHNMLTSESVRDKRSLNKLLSIMGNLSHPLHDLKLRQ